eukprot:GHVN01003756.1.p2 GENE.GHVN01003756.1~~GHVN01003756.1.p2  ORF type:complete len:430 (-),score=90.97 GHVN01003756.1:2044-3207(-)
MKKFAREGSKTGEEGIEGGGKGEGWSDDDNGSGSSSSPSDEAPDIDGVERGVNGDETARDGEGSEAQKWKTDVTIDVAVEIADGDWSRAPGTHRTQFAEDGEQLTGPSRGPLQASVEEIEGRGVTGDRRGGDETSQMRASSHTALGEKRNRQSKASSEGDPKVINRVKAKPIAFKATVVDADGKRREKVFKHGHRDYHTMYHPSRRQRMPWGFHWADWVTRAFGLTALLTIWIVTWVYLVNDSVYIGVNPPGGFTFYGARECICCYRYLHTSSFMGRAVTWYGEGDEKSSLDQGDPTYGDAVLVSLVDGARIPAHWYHIDDEGETSSDSLELNVAERLAVVSSAARRKLQSSTMVWECRLPSIRSEWGPDAGTVLTWNEWCKVAPAP